jgi:FxsC-like protein
MSIGGAVGNEPAWSYFYLSYAHSLPLAVSNIGPPDARVHSFYRDLARAVQRHARLPHLVAGYFDQELPLGPEDRKRALESAIGAAEVFVPLCSPSYITRSWTGRELACFEQRMTAAGISDPMARVVPVLWTPPQPGQILAEPADAEHLVPSATAADYVENGLVGLMRLAPYRQSYELVVDRLAGRIVRIAEAAPVRPSPVPDISQVQSKFKPEPGAAIFIVAVAASSRHEAAYGSNQMTYGPSGSSWRPFEWNLEFSLADYAAVAAEQFSFVAKVAELDETSLFSRAPGVVLIDPWYAADERHLRTLSRVIEHLPTWIFPVLIPDIRGGQRVQDLASSIRKLIKTSEFRPDSAELAIGGVRSHSEFVNLMPYLIHDAQRNFLKNANDPSPAIISAADRQSTSGSVEVSERPVASHHRRSGHAFISYVEEDLAQVAQLQTLLFVAGVPMWRDADDLLPGDVRSEAIRDAITADSIAFLACFSRSSRAQATSNQNEQLLLAIEEARRRPPRSPWIIPIRFDDCEIPDLDIGGGRRLRDIQSVDLFGDSYFASATRLITALKRILPNA